MTLWWIGFIVLTFVVVPVVVAILLQVLTPIMQIRKYAEDITEHVALFPPHLDDTVEELLKTRDLVKTASPLLGRYVQAIDRL